MIRKHSLSLIMFLIGLGAMTKVVLVGSIAISEIFIFLLAPFIAMKDFRSLKRDGFVPVLLLLSLTMCGCVVATIVNHAPLFRSVKVLAQYYALFAIIVVAHRLLSRDPASLKWFLCGAFISGLITIFAFNTTIHGSSTGMITLEESTAAEVVNGPLFWMFQLQNALNGLIGGLYFNIPYLLCVSAPIGAIVITALTGISGRAFSLCLLATWGLIVYCRKSISRMQSVSRHFIVVAIVGFIALFCFKSCYSYLAKNGMLGDEARIKYFAQTKSGDSILRLLMGGRVEFFIGMRAAFDKPIIGYGVLPCDTKGYIQEFYTKYGDEQDLRNYMQSLLRNGSYVEHVIPTHSYIAGSWVFCGISGLVLWIYVLRLCYMFFRKWITAIPEWFGYFAMGIPIFVWDIFFSPITNRMLPAFMITALLLAKAVYERRVMLPLDMSDVKP